MQQLTARRSVSSSLLKFLVKYSLTSSVMRSSPRLPFTTQPISTSLKIFRLTVSRGIPAASLMEKALVGSKYLRRSTPLGMSLRALRQFFSTV